MSIVHIRCKYATKYQVYTNISGQDFFFNFSRFPFICHFSTHRDFAPLNPHPGQALDPLPFQAQFGEGPDDSLLQSAKVPVDVLPVPSQVHDRVHDNLRVRFWVTDDMIKGGVREEGGGGEGG